MALFLYKNKKYTNNKGMRNYYKRSLKQYKRMLKKNISEEEWNEYAHRKGYCSSFTLMAHEDAFNWEDLRSRQVLFDWKKLPLTFKKLIRIINMVNTNEE